MIESVPYLKELTPSMVWGLFGILLIFFITKTSGSKSDFEPFQGGNIGYMKQIKTHLGELRIKVLGDMNQVDKIGVVCLNGINPKLSSEWLPTAEKLSQKGHRVIIIDFHSNEKTAPKLLWGGISDADVQRIVRDNIIFDEFKAKKVVLLGKSWGGRQASLFAGRYPQLVSKLGLICPASSRASIVNGMKESKVPTFMGWAKDDYVKWYSNTFVWKSALSDQLTLVTAEKGGHFILPEFVEPLIRFIDSD